MKKVTLRDYKRRILRVLVHIQQHLDDPLPLRDLAALACFSPYHFHRIFKGMVSESVKEHVRRLRLERAAGQLKLGARSITRLAFDAGYESHESFTRSFQLTFGVSPSRFRALRKPRRPPPAPSGVHHQAGKSTPDFKSFSNGGITMKVESKHLNPIRVAFMRHVGPYSKVGATWDKFLPFPSFQSCNMKPEKLDLYKTHKAEYVASRKPLLIETKPANYLAISGQGAPGGEYFSASIGALYGVAFTIKMTRKFAGQQDYAVCKLEGQWWCDSGPDFSKVLKADWRWTLLIRTPDFIKRADLEKAVAVLLKRGKGEDVKRIQLETLAEGPCVQMLHVGPYEKEHETVELMRVFTEKKGLRFHGRHHEVYLSDPRRVRPERLKTILREPVKRDCRPWRP